MTVNGIRRQPFSRVVLDEFFEAPTYVDVKVISPYGRAQIRETLMASFSVGDIDAKGVASQIKTKFEGMADREMAVRKMKLRFAFAGTNMAVDGAPAIWDEKLWDALDEADQRILDTVLDRIDEVSKLTAKGKEGDTDPTLPQIN